MSRRILIRNLEDARGHRAVVVTTEYETLRIEPGRELEIDVSGGVWLATREIPRRANVDPEPQYDYTATQIDPRAPALIKGVNFSPDEIAAIQGGGASNMPMHLVTRSDPDIAVRMHEKREGLDPTEAALPARSPDDESTSGQTDPDPIWSTREELEAMTFADLRALAGTKDIKGRAKAELVDEILAWQEAQNPNAPAAG